TAGGGKSDLSSAGRCAWDALAFVYVARRALASGSVPPPARIYFGGPYSVRLEYGGEQTIKVSDRPAAADRVSVSLQGPASSSTFEMFFARDAVRTPLLIRIPTVVGAISL